jgi:hypothetical protein
MLAVEIDCGSDTEQRPRFRRVQQYIKVDQVPAQISLGAPGRI